eukprot:1797538-Prymnesium_polylepis.1
MVRSVDLYSFYIACASCLDPTRGRLFSRDPANARDVPAGPPVAPPRSTLRADPPAPVQKCCGT